jgi:hypothetical protein
MIIFLLLSHILSEMKIVGAGDQKNGGYQKKISISSKKAASDAQFNPPPGQWNLLQFVNKPSNISRLIDIKGEIWRKGRRRKKKMEIRIGAKPTHAKMLSLSALPHTIPQGPNLRTADSTLTLLTG